MSIKQAIREWVKDNYGQSELENPSYDLAALGSHLEAAQKAAKAYNGWSNYETWLVNLHYDGVFEDEAQTAWDEAKADDTFSRAENAALTLRHTIKEQVEEFAQEQVCTENGFVSDLLNGMISEVNFYEIAQAYISTKVTEQKLKAKAAKEGK